MSEITVRDATLRDAAGILKIYAPYIENTAITFEYEVPSLPAFEARMAHIMEKYPYIVAVADGVIRGYAYASAFRSRAAYGWACEMTIYLDPCIQKCGAGKKLYAALEERLQRMGVLNCYACIAYPEEEDAYLTKNSYCFHSHLGYREVGRFHKCAYKFGRWYDMVYLEKAIGRHGTPQADIVPYKDL